MQNKTRKLENWNYNVKLVFIFTIIQRLGTGIWMGNILSSYIYLLTNSSSELLGLTSLATGLPMTLVVIPSGILSDKFRRDWMLRFSALTGLIGLIIIYFANTFELIFIALIFWGLYQGLLGPPLEALFADSIPSGTRSGIYSKRNFVMQLAIAAGPFLNVGLFWLLGDEWEINILKIVMAVGLGFSTLSLIVMLFFKDTHALGEQSESVITSILEKQSQPTSKSIPIDKRNKYSFVKGFKKKSKFLSIKHVPLILVASNVVIGIGAGMTIKFFPIFFWEEYAMQPIMVQLIMGTTSIATGIAVLIAQHFSRYKGRAQMIFVVQGLATLCLGIIAFYPAIWILIPTFVLRGALMNSAQPLSRSILMDIVPKKNRAKWNSLETLAWGLFWNFSAVIGGYLIGSENNFRRNFIVTFGIYVLGTSLIILLFPLVGEEKTNIKQEKNQIK